MRRVLNKPQPKAKDRRDITKSSQSGLPEGWTRATFIVQEGTLEKIKDLAYTERKQLKEVVTEALEAYMKGKKIIKKEGRQKEGDRNTFMGSCAYFHYCPCCGESLKNKKG